MLRPVRNDLLHAIRLLHRLGVDQHTLHAVGQACVSLVTLISLSSIDRTFRTLTSTWISKAYQHHSKHASTTSSNSSIRWRRECKLTIIVRLFSCCLIHLDRSCWWRWALWGVSLWWSMCTRRNALRSYLPKGLIGPLWTRGRACLSRLRCSKRVLRNQD